MTDFENSKKCSMCRGTILLTYFDKNRKGLHYKSCRDCLKSQRDRRQRNKADQTIKEIFKHIVSKKYERLAYNEWLKNQNRHNEVSNEFEIDLSNFHIK